MKKIISISTEHTDTITEAIRAAEGRATARTITAEDVVEACTEVTKALQIPKRAMEGIQIHVDAHAQSFPKAYRYTPESTHFKATYKAGGWRLDEVYRAQCSAPSKRLQVTHTDASRAALMDRFEAWA